MSARQTLRRWERARGKGALRRAADRIALIAGIVLFTLIWLAILGATVAGAIGVLVFLFHFLRHAI